LVDSVESMMMHGLAKPKFVKLSLCTLWRRVAKWSYSFTYS